MNIVVFWEEGFPCVDTVATPQEVLRAAVKEGDTLSFVGVAGLGAALNDVSVVLVTPYGSAFPKVAWPAIYDFLNRGGSWVNIGGSPLSRPVRQNRDGSWHVEVSTTAYSKELLINQAFPIDLNGKEKAGWWDTVYLPDPLPPFKCSRSWSLQVRFTDTKDFSQEHGTSGTRDAALYPLLHMVQGERSIAAPIVMIDRLRGRFAGGRWLLINAHLTDPLSWEYLYAYLKRAAQGPIEIDVRPTFACYYEAEMPALVVRVKAHRLCGTATLETQLNVAKDSTWSPPTHNVILSNMPSYHEIRLYLDAREESLDPGLYTAFCSLMIGEEPIAIGMTGFWIYDEALLTSGKPLTVNRDYFERDGEPYPVMGTTYMAGDVHRKFLFEPNPAVWDRDFAAMKAAGVNMVRTGLWTAWKRAMLDPGAIDEGVLRAFTAFLLTARKYDIPVIFNFFAFWPEEWGGLNPYLDPRAISAQQELVAAFAHRFAKVDDLIWDFINEPSATSPARVWSCRPNYDPYEKAAWAKWLEKRAASFSEEEKQAADPADVWRERWRLTPNAPLDLPALADFQDQYIFQGTHPLRVMDFRLFAQDVFNDWVRQMTAAVRSNDNPRQLITVGQDEGGIWERPNPHFHAEVVDFTTNHTWWQNDDLLWDSVMTKTPNKPNLIQETGIMFYENVDGGYRFTPEHTANLLARKLVLSFAAGCAGAIQWLWNTNIYMDSDNEVGIGFHRADGTEKPELEAFRGIAKFIWENRHRMVGRQLEETVLVIPFSNMFSVRNTADPATRRAVRVLEYSLGVPVRTVSEYHMQDIGDPKLIVLPSPRVLTQSCWEALLAKVEAGATLLVTGFIEEDEYRRHVSRLRPFGLETVSAPVLHEETFIVTHETPDYDTITTTFSGDQLQKVDKAVVTNEQTVRRHVFVHGKGRFLYCPIPLELSDWEDYIFSLAVADAGLVTREISESSLALIRAVTLKDTKLYLFSNETPETIPLQEIFPDADLPAGSGAAGFVSTDGTVESFSIFSGTKRKENEGNAKETNQSG